MGGGRRVVDPVSFPGAVVAILAVALVVYLAVGWWLLHVGLPALHT